MSRFRWLKNYLFSVAACLVLLCSTTAQALTIQLSLSELTGLADTIVVGTVVSRSSRWNAEHNNIYTEVVVAVTDNLKGKSGKKTVAIIVPGGTVGDIEQWVEDTATFEVGEQVGLFLEDLNSAKVSKMGLDTASQMAADGSVGRIIGGLQGKRTLAKDNQSPDKRISADTFKQQVQMALDGQAVPAEESQRFLEGEASSNLYDISTISPIIASAGTDTLVTVTGLGFGTRGPGDCLLFFAYGSSYYCAPIVSWSDTQIKAYVPENVSSGPVRTYKGGQWGPPINFTVTFGYESMSWFGDSPNIIYKVNEGGVAGRLAAIQAGAASWNNADAKFKFTYGGTHTQTVKSYNGVNEILWMPLPAGVLGEATTTAYTSGRIIECDFAFNTAYTWSYSATCPPGQYDIQSVGTHEMGHWLLLSDLYGDYPGFTQDTAKVMYGRQGSGTIAKRTLHAHDILGIQWIYGSLWTRLTGDNPDNMVASGLELYGDFGTLGLWKWNGDSWARLTVDSPENMVASGSALYGDFGPLGLWMWDGDSWARLTTANPENMVASGSELYADFGPAGLWKWNGDSWARLTVDSPENIVASGSALYGDFGTLGLWMWDGDSWARLTTANPENMVASGSELYADFGPAGLWKWNGDSWARLTVDSPENMVASGSALYGDFGPLGLWMWDGDSWARLTTANPENMVASGSELYADFGPAGLCKWDGTTWTLLTVDSPENMVAAGSTLYGDFGLLGLRKWDQ